MLNSNCGYNFKPPAPLTAAAFNGVYCSGVECVCKPLGVLETLSWVYRVKIIFIITPRSSLPFHSRTLMSVRGVSRGSGMCAVAVD